MTVTIELPFILDYIRPFFNDNEVVLSNKIRYKKPKYVEYLYFIIYVMELYLPILKEKFVFSEEINIYLDFDGNEIDTEFTKIILVYFSMFYPLSLNKLCIESLIL